MLTVVATEPGAFSLSGEVDCSNVTALAESLETAADGHSELRLDMSQLAFIDVSGLRALLEASLLLEERGGELVLLSPRAILRRMIALLGIDGRLTIRETA